jgi:hypothetical protein
MPGSQRLTRTQEKAIAALLAERTIQDAAARAKVSERTLTYWLKLPAFAAEYRHARQRVVEHAVGKLQAASSLAVDALVKNLSCGKPAVEVTAANSLLAHSLAAVEQFDVVSQIEALKELIAQQGAGYENRRTFSNGQANDGPRR